MIETTWPPRVAICISIQGVWGYLFPAISVRDWNRMNSVFETELRLTFSPIFRKDAMALVGSQGTILSTMASISSENVAA
jgi:hypothetical protein